jgi:hypothetical protein
MRTRQFLLAAVAALLLPSATQAAPPCAGFNDVDAASPFCPNVEWMKNRGITSGCAPGLYCPSDAVSRLHMAGFMNRLGNTLTPQVVFVEGGYGATDLDAGPILCQTGDVASPSYPRSANARGNVLLRANGTFSANMQLVISNDGGANWAPLTTNDFGLYAVGSYGEFTNAHAFTGLVPLVAGGTYRFGIKLTRATGAGQIEDGDCHLAVELRSRAGAVSPI